MKKFYLVCCVLGTLLPYWQLFTWLSIHGLDIPMLFQEIVSSPIGAMAWLDVVISALVLMGFILYEGGRLKMKNLWIPMVGTCTVGVSLGLPLFLFLREVHKESY